MITDASPRDCRLSWNDVEALPLYAGVLLLGGMLLHGLSGLGPAIQGEAVKAGFVLGFAALSQRLGADDGPVV
jgi:hypothetical protein